MNYLIVQSLLSVNPSGMFKKNILMSALKEWDKMYMCKVSRRLGQAWAVQDATYLRATMKELKRIKRNQKTSERTVSWLAKLLGLMTFTLDSDCDSDDDSALPLAFPVAHQPFSLSAKQTKIRAATQAQAKQGSTRALVYRLSSSPTKLMTPKALLNVYLLFCKL
jgi:hypothetical protein